MEKGNIKIVEIADFKNSEHVLDYVDNDFVIINSLEGSPYNEDTIRLGCFLIAICLEGCIQLDVNYKTYQLAEQATYCSAFPIPLSATRW